MERCLHRFESAKVVQSHTLSGHKIDENGQRSKNARSRATPLQSTWPYSRLAGQMAFEFQPTLPEQRSHSETGETKGQESNSAQQSTSLPAKRNVLAQNLSLIARGAVEGCFRLT